VKKLKINKRSEIQKINKSEIQKINNEIQKINK